MLTKEQKAQWVKALRSGEYVQGKDYLKRVDTDGITKHCCLGVLCDVLGMPNRVTPTGITVFLRNRESTIPEHILGTLTGTSVGSFKSLNMPELYGLSCLTEVNDKGYSFNSIADHIEQHLPTSD